MSTPWFFLSYASVDPAHDTHVAEFHSHLVTELRAVAHLKKTIVPDSDVGFLDTGMGNGTIWPEALASALRKCRVLVCLYSEGYFESVPCGKEFTIFNSRIDDWVEADQTRQRPALIMPVLWLPPEDFHKTCPSALSSIHYADDFSDVLVKAGGLYFVKKHGMPGDYDKFVSYLAKEIYRVANPPVVPTLTKVTPFDQVESAFHQGIQLPQVTPPAAPRDLKATVISARQIDLAWGGGSGDESGFHVERCEGADCTNFVRVTTVAADQTTFADDRLKPRTTYNYRVRAFNGGGYADYSKTAMAATPRDWRPWLYAIAAACAIPVLILLIKLVINSNPQRPTNTETNTNNSNSSITIRQPGVSSTPFSDGFARSGAPAEHKWLEMDKWDLSPQWSVEWGTTDDGWLNVQGMEPEIVKEVFDNFEFDLPMEFAVGAKVGWVLRAQGDRQAGYSGYCFVLEPDGDAFRLVWYWGKPQERPTSTQAERVGITEFGKEEKDRIDVDGRLEGDTFRFTFKLANPIPDNRTRQNFALIEGKMSGEHPKSGYVGLFAGDNTSKFKVNTLQITPLEPVPPQ